MAILSIPGLTCSIGLTTSNADLGTLPAGKLLALRGQQPHRHRKIDFVRAAVELVESGRQGFAFSDLS
jgi:hypothetical protein